MTSQLSALGSLSKTQADYIGSRPMSPLLVILSTQRAGSTFLETSIASLGGIGHPAEHFAQPFVDEILGKSTHSPLGSADFEQHLARCTTPYGMTAFTLMADYLTFVARMALDEPYQIPAYDLDPVMRFWDMLRTRYNPFICLRLTRDPVEQGISQYFSHRTRLNHVINGVEQFHLGGGGMTHADALENLDLDELTRCVQTIVHQNMFLDGFLEAAGGEVLNITYRELCDDYQGVAKRIAEASHGLTRKDEFTMATRKVVASEYVDGARSKLANALNVDLDPDDANARLRDAAMAYAHDRMNWASK